jgi:hypothetical protein
MGTSLNDMAGGVEEDRQPTSKRIAKAGRKAVIHPGRLVVRIDRIVRQSEGFGDKVSGMNRLD